MTRSERVLVLTGLVVLVALLLATSPVAASLGAVAGVAAALPLADRLGRVRRTVDARLGADLPVPRGGLRVELVVRRLLLQVGVLGVLLLVSALVPLAGERAFAAAAAAATALPAVLTAQRLRG